MTNISLPDAAGENLFKKELLEVMLVCPQWVYTYVRSQKLAISCLKGLYLSWDTAEAAIFLMLMRNQITPGQLIWRLNEVWAWIVCILFAVRSIHIQYPQKSKQKWVFPSRMPRSDYPNYVLSSTDLCWLEYQISSTHDAELCVTKNWSNNSQ